MNQLRLLFQLLPGFIPLFIFIAADEIWGTRIGLVIAVVFGILELIFYRIKDKHFDKFILFDTLLIAALGVVSIIFDNDVFFKLKPALMSLVMVIILGVSAFSPANLMLNMSKRYMRGIKMNDTQVRQLKKSTRTMFFIFSAYTLLVFYSVWFMSKEAWAFISGGLFYIVFAVYMVYGLIKNRKERRRLKAQVESQAAAREAVRSAMQTPANETLYEEIYKQWEQRST